MGSPADGLFQISVVENDVGTLSSQFESDGLQIRLGSGFHDFTADKSTSSERNLVDLHVRRNGGPNSLPVAGHNVHDTVGNASFFYDLAHTDCGQRCEFGGLQNDGVAGGQSRCNLP